ncbi:hypothetical protein B0H16DRAFT_1751040 [Mycena metata]|uniref:Uncharacterized protein n=1 Tax=Mycena metata TaxID=1033252 RepID=A0AAD7GH49_9AGAR|nr:hypothetical protein B0H16DRAFT_1751040 [Mycena metata]
MAGARMILDAVLLDVVKICADGDTKLPVAVLPEMRIASGDGILLKNPTTSFEMWLTGSVDYAMRTYENESEWQGRILNADVHDVGRLACSKIFLTIIEGKRLEDKTLYEFMPQAISQAAALCEATRSTAVRFCLADGRKWIFSVFAKDDRGARVCYEGNVVSILEPRFDAEGRDTAWEQSIHQVVEILVTEEHPLAEALYRLEDQCTFDAEVAIHS